MQIQLGKDAMSITNYFPGADGIWNALFQSNYHTTSNVTRYHKASQVRVYLYVLFYSF